MINVETPLVSVVITTKNEEKNIRVCLESIKNQTWNSIEIIVVDNASTDKTKEIAKQYTDKVFDKGPERSAQRNYGMINVASGKFVIYVDADMLLSPLLIETCVENMRDELIVGLYIPETVLGKKYFSRVRRFERHFYNGTSIDGARFFRKDIFKKVGGFDEKLFIKGSGEDWDIDKKIKMFGLIKLLSSQPSHQKSVNWPLEKFIGERGVKYEDSYVGIYHNESEFNVSKYLKKKLYYSKGFDGYISKWGKEDADIQKQFGIKYRFFTVFFENGKYKDMIKHPILVIGMYALRFLVGIIFILRRLI